MDDFWSASVEYLGPPLTDLRIAQAERDLGYRLPASYVALLLTQNGGTPRRTCFPTDVPTSWARDHVCMIGIRGIGGYLGIDDKEHGSRVWIEQCGYPDIGIIVGECPSGGHDAIMLDYRLCGARGEPSVIHVETECDVPAITMLAPSFAAFLAGLRDEREFELG